MQLIIFYIFAAIAVMSAIMVITRRNIVHCALFLVLTILCTAGIYILLHAEFIAAIQILLYAGSVIVMFLFVISISFAPGGFKINQFEYSQRPSLTNRRSAAWRLHFWYFA